MGSNTSRDMSDVHVVIVGGGYGGSKLAYSLISKNICKTTMIDPKSGLFHNMGALRAAVNEEYSNKLYIPYEKLGTSHVQAKAVGLDTKSKTVVLDNGEQITYTHLVIATGSSYSFPVKLDQNNLGISTDECLKMYSDYRKEITAADKIVIVGGGAVGVEFAGEIKCQFPGKKVTIISSHGILASERTKPSFQTKLAKALESKHIEVLLNERVANLDELTLNKNVNSQVVKTESGKELVCDMVVPCTGTAPNNQFFKEELADAINENGLLRVNEHLQVEGYTDVFAIGDINDVKEEKMAYTAKLQADVLLENIKGKSAVHKPQTPGQLIMIIPLGKDGGVGQITGMVVGDTICYGIKSMDLFAKQEWSGLGLKVPK